MNVFTLEGRPRHQYSAASGASGAAIQLAWMKSAATEVLVFHRWNRTWDAGEYALTTRRRLLVAPTSTEYANTSFTFYSNTTEGNT